MALLGCRAVMDTFLQTLSSPAQPPVGNLFLLAAPTTKAAWLLGKSTQPTDAFTSLTEARRTVPCSTRSWFPLDITYLRITVLLLIMLLLCVGWVGLPARGCPTRDLLLATMPMARRSMWLGPSMRESRFLESSCLLSTQCTYAGTDRRSWSRNLRSLLFPMPVGCPVAMDPFRQAQLLEDIPALESHCMLDARSTRAVWHLARCIPVMEAFTFRSEERRFLSRITRFLLSDHSIGNRFWCGYLPSIWIEK